jgi:hypothetical protein
MIGDPDISHWVLRPRIAGGTVNHLPHAGPAYRT